MVFLEIIKAIFFGIVEGITEWLPVSSTGHLIILEEIIPLNMTSEFYSLFQVVIQLGAILAVVVIFWNNIWPFKFDAFGKIAFKTNKKELWINIIVSCIPAVIVGLLFDDLIDKYLYNYIVVSIALIVVGFLFILIENIRSSKKAAIRKVEHITPRLALYIGLFQVIAALFPGTSRSGATILGALLLGVSRDIAAQYSFYLAIPVMAGASFLKIVKYIFKFGFNFSKIEIISLIVASIVAFVVSLFVIKLFMNFVKEHNFKGFGVYRIALGIIVLISFILFL